MSPIKVKTVLFPQYHGAQFVPEGYQLERFDEDHQQQKDRVETELFFENTDILR